MRYFYASNHTPTLTTTTNKTNRKANAMRDTETESSGHVGGNAICAIHTDDRTPASVAFDEVPTDHGGNACFQPSKTVTSDTPIVPGNSIM